MPGADSPDHVIPRAHGGTDDLANLRPAHRRCNSARRDMPLEQWRAAHPLPSRAPPSRRW
nr:HNH endonuclease signature motif containing protein [Corynebacterium heidelbergense]